MKIIEDTPDRLVFESRPVLFAFMAAAMALALTAAAIGLFTSGAPGRGLLLTACLVLLAVPMIFVTFERVRVIFDAREGICTLRRRNLRGDGTRTHKLSTVIRAMVQTRKGDGESSDAHRIALVIGADTAANRHPLTRFHVSGPAAETATDRINAWLRATRSDG
ncbi:hypothetical protein [Roseobacter ponti]|uniref:Integral membrane protein n=1 Tax=Roseobacter ponti TaxID=1891787 RepID=A0A858SX66_9RHOB|nr:hypothetical protein [Roseobacter ponti]QJF52647.1 hypothetical protein G3256_16455 [Roseobacter ponti]